MSFNRRGPDRRPDRDRQDRPDRPQRRPGGDWQPRERPSGDRPYQPRGGDRPFTPRPRFDRGTADEGGMSIRLDPRRLGVLKRLAADANVRPGDLVRQWTEERLDGERAPTPAAAGVAEQLAALMKRVEALESRSAAPVATESAADAAEPPPAAPPTPETPEPAAPEPIRRRNASKVSAIPRERIALHDEMIAVLAERGPMSAGELASAVAKRGRYAPPRSGKPLDAAMISQRVSNPTYRARFTRNEGRIGLADASEPA
jgi:hypothetical protein